MGAQVAKVTFCGSVCQTEAHDANCDLEVSHPPNEDSVCAMVVSLLFASYLVSSKSGLSGPGRWETVSLAHRPREGRLGAKSDTCFSIFSACQPENHLLLLPFSPAATVRAHNDQRRARMSRSQSASRAMASLPWCTAPQVSG